jgi:hypothetical protein
MKVICFSTSDEQDRELRNLAPSREYPTMSFLLRYIISEFLKDQSKQDQSDQSAQP